MSYVRGRAGVLINSLVLVKCGHLLICSLIWLNPDHVVLICSLIWLNWGNIVQMYSLVLTELK